MSAATVRSLRRSDAGEAARLVAHGMVTGQPWAGWTEEPLRRRTARLLRAQATLGGILGRSLVAEGADGGINGVATWVPGRRAGWLAAVGLARGPAAGEVAGALLEATVRAGIDRGRSSLLVPGWTWAGSGLPEEVLEAAGFREIAARRLWQREPPIAPSAERSPRPARVPRGPARASLLEGLRAERGADLESIEPSTASDLSVGAATAWALGSTTALFLGRADGRPTTAVRATRGRDTVAAHLAVVRPPDGPETDGVATIGRALRWCAVPGVRSVVAESADAASATAPLLARSGFVPGPRSRTLVRTIGAGG